MSTRPPLVPASWRTAFVAVRKRWQGLSQRERMQVGWMLAVVALAATWFLAVQPALQTLAHWEQELPRLRSQSAALQAVLAEVPRTARQPAEAGAAPPSAQRVRASLDAAGLAGAYRLVEPAPEGSAGAPAEVQIEFEPADDAAGPLAWLLDAPEPLGLRLRRVVVDSAGPAGRRVGVKATLVVQATTGRTS